MKRAIALVLLLVSASAAHAEEGLDLVVLLDSSASMGRGRQVGPLLLRMAVELLARNAAANRIDHRLAVISFGTAARVELPFANVNGDLARRVEGLAIRNLGDTNVLAAFAAADALIQQLAPDPRRRRAVLLLTDGIPYVRGTDMKSYRDALLHFADMHFRRAGIAVDVVLLTPGALRDEAFWRSLATHAEPAGATPDRVLAAAHGAITRLAGTRVVESTSKSGDGVDILVIPPYLDVVVFDVFRGARNAEVKIFPPAATEPVSDGTNGVQSFRVGQVLSTLVVPRPPPGEWIIRRSHSKARVRVLSQQFFPRGTLMIPRPGETMRQFDRVGLVYRITDNDGESLRELPGYELSVDVVLLKPDGTSTPVPTRRDARTTFNALHVTECELAGRYWTDVRISTVDAHGRRLEVFRDRWSGFTVSVAARRPAAP